MALARTNGDGPALLQSNGSLHHSSTAEETLSRYDIPTYGSNAYAANTFSHAIAHAVAAATDGTEIPNGSSSNGDVAFV